MAKTKKYRNIEKRPDSENGNC